MSRSLSSASRGAASRGLGALVLAAALFAAPSVAPASVGGIGDLFVTSDASNMTRAYAGVTGSYLGVFTGAVLGNGILGIHFGATNGRALVGSFGGGVDEYDASTGAYIKTYETGGGWQWAGVYGPNGNVYIGSFNTNDVREYDASTGAFISVLTPILGPADMEYGPNGNLYICSYQTGEVLEVDPTNGNPINNWFLPAGSAANDVAFLPGGRVLVTAMNTNLTYVYAPPPVLVAQFTGTGWARPHGIVISPHSGNILIADGVTTQVHEFNPSTYAEITPAFLSPGPGDKIVDVAFRPELPTPARASSWGRIKGQYR